MSLSTEISSLSTAIGEKIKEIITTLSGKQDTLISTINIKTVNGVSILGSGNLTVETGDKTQTAVMTATQASSTTLIAGVTQLAIGMVANGVYKVDAFVTFKSSVITTGAKIGFTSPTGCMCMVDVVVTSASTANNTALKTTFPSAAVATNIGEVAGTGVTAANSNHTARISGIIRNGANAGNFQVTFASENSISSITLQIGSVLQLTRVA